MSLLAERQEGGCACVYVFLKGGVCMCVCVFLIKADCALASLTHLKQAPRLAFQKTHELWSGR